MSRTKPPVTQLLIMMQAYMTYRISITARKDPSAAVRVSLMDYELVCDDEDHKQRLQETIERVRPLIKGHEYATNLCNEMKQTCRDIIGWVRPEKPVLQMIREFQAKYGLA
jgi:hypothetical protein